jgi:predicted flap endonuclease-1-like 5' DNA nuclease
MNNTAPIWMGIAAIAGLVFVVALGVAYVLYDLAMGIFHFDQIASWGPQELAWMDANLQGFKGRASRDGWVAQAKALAAGA